MENIKKLFTHDIEKDKFTILIHNDTLILSTI